MNRFFVKRYAGITLFAFVGMLVVFSLAYAQEPKYKYAQHGKRDPFVPLVSPAGYLLNLEQDEESALSLEGIMYDPRGESIAIINGELVKEGETFGEVVVSSIQPTKVIVIKDNQKVEIELRREE